MNPSPITLKSILECTVEKVVSGGFGLSRIDGKVIFIEGALPQEIVKVEVHTIKKDLLWARVIEVIQAHPERRIAPCEFFEKCGGCHLQYATIELQNTIKKSIFEDGLKRIGKLSEYPEIEFVSGPEWAYRSRAKVKIKSPTLYGFSGRESHQFVPIKTCNVLTPRLNTWLQNRPQIKSTPQGDVQAFDNHSKVFAGHHADDFSVVVKNKTFWLNNRVFFQSNLILLEQFIDFAMPPKPVNLAIDLYSGVGLFAAFLEDYSEKVIAVEREKECLRLAQKNTSSSKTSFFSGSTEDWIVKNPNLKPDWLIVDPPRAGLDKGVIQQISQWNIDELCYLSCNPDTFARDLNIFKSFGYEATEIKAFDFYPQTFHLEVGAKLKRV